MVSQLLVFNPLLRVRKKPSDQRKGGQVGKDADEGREEMPHGKHVSRIAIGLADHQLMEQAGS